MRRRSTAQYATVLWILGLIIVCSILLATVLRSPASPETFSAPRTPPSPSPSPPLPIVTYHVVGKEIIDNNGQVFVPYGVHLIGLFAYNWQGSVGYQHLNFAQMKQAHTIWHANTVGVQLASGNLFTDPSGTSYNQKYLQAIDQEVTWAHWAGMNILLILQYEATHPQPLPTTDSVKFWDLLSRRYHSDPWVFFDVFNEPVSPSGLTEAQTWPLWQYGGQGYTGMQDLVNTIRGNGAKNLIFIDGLAAGEDLRGVPAHRLKGTNLIYAIHPYAGIQHQSKPQWDSWFGDVAAQANFPVVADEWNAYQSDTAECVLQVPTLVPQLLNYLAARHIGLMGWALFPGLLIRGWDYTNPTAFDQPTFTCTGTFPNYDSRAQGAGLLLQRYFATHT